MDASLLLDNLLSPPIPFEAIRPILERFGGVALVTDALWVRH